MIHILVLSLQTLNAADSRNCLLSLNALLLYALKLILILIHAFFISVCILFVVFLLAGWRFRVFVHQTVGIIFVQVI